MFQDETLVCRDCGVEFVFTTGEQEFYAERGFQNKPTRCRDCRQSHKQNRNQNAGGGHREMHDATCAQCGAQTQVPFLPKNDRPIYCSECFASMRGR